MAQSTLGEVLRVIHRIYALQGACDLTDRALVERYVANQDETAFALLVKRHGPMVFGVSRRLLGGSHEAEEVYQATFLVLVKRIGSIKGKQSVGSWLYGVARRIALRVRAQTALRRQREREAGLVRCGRGHDEPSLQELRSVLDEEIGLLPEKYRAAIVLCCLEGKTYKQAARQLGCPESTLSARVTRGKALLAGRLARHGFGCASATVAGLFAGEAAVAAVPPALMAATVKIVGSAGSGKGAGAGVVSAEVVALTEGVLKSMLFTKLKVGSALVVVGAVMLTSALLWAFQEPTPQRSKTKPVASAQVQKTAAKFSYIVRVPSQFEGLIQFIGTEIKEGETVPQENLLNVLVGGKKLTFRRLKKGDAVREGQLLGRVDDRLARADLALYEAKATGAKYDYNGAKAIAVEAENKYQQARVAYYNKGGRAISEEEYRNAILTRDKMESDALSKQSSLKVAELELQKLTVLELHDIRTRVNGVIVNIRKHPGEAVKKWETVVEVEVTEK